ncbi:MAG TPA: small metal-binding protein SmbP, partial [Nitrospira sp.]
REGMASDRVVPCADQAGDMTTSSDCEKQSRQTADGRAWNDPAMTACTYTTDAKGNVIYDDPNCPTRYRQSQRSMGSSYENVRWTQESAFFDRHIEKAVNHAREAEIAGNQGHAPELFRHAQLSLDYAKEAQRAGNVPGVKEGIISLRDVLNSTPDGRTWNDRRASDPALTSCSHTSDARGNVIYDDPNCPARYRQASPSMNAPNGSLRDATATVRDARINLSRAAGIKPINTRTPATAIATSGMPVRTVRGELIGEQTPSSLGDNRYLLRDRNGRDIPVLLTDDMTRKVQVGDVVEAQVDSDGRVVAINKYQ